MQEFLQERLLLMNFRLFSLRLFSLLVIFTIFTFVSSKNTYGQTDDPMTITGKSTGAAVDVTFLIKNNLHVYKDSISFKLLKPKNVKLKEPFFPQGISKIDPLSGKPRIHFASETAITILLAQLDPDSKSIEPNKSDYVDFEIEVSWQACVEEMCLMPESTVIKFKGKLDDSLVNTLPKADVSKKTLKNSAIENIGESTDDNAQQSSTEKSSDDMAKDLTDNWGILGYYLAGIILSLTPCIFPMIPVTMSIIGSKEGTPLQGFIRSIIYVSGLALTYAILGMFAALGGGVIGAAMQNPFVLVFIFLLFFVMGLSMLDIVQFQMPAFLQPKGGQKKDGGYIALFFTGMAAGLVASPCVAPFIIAILGHIAQEGNYISGFFNLFALGFGLGTILIFVGTFSSAMQSMPRAGNWMNHVKKILGMVLIFAAFYYLQGALSIKVFSYVFGVFLIIAGIVSGATDSLAPEAILYPRLVKATGMVMLIIGIYMFGGQLLISGFVLPPMTKLPFAEINGINAGTSTTSVPSKPAIDWQPVSLDKIDQATKDGKPVAIDFGAKWCTVCHELEELTFTDSKIIEEFKRFRTMKADMTKPGPKLEAIRIKYKVGGFPTVIFIDSKGKVRNDLTSIGFKDVKAFLGLMKQVD